jgi:hypothetical protein
MPLRGRERRELCRKGNAELGVARRRRTGSEGGGENRLCWLGCHSPQYQFTRGGGVKEVIIYDHCET